jgi:hypothetical protein
MKATFFIPCFAHLKHFEKVITLANEIPRSKLRGISFADIIKPFPSKLLGRALSNR